VVCDEMIDPLVDEKLESIGIDVKRPEPSDSDTQVLELSKSYSAPIITRDKDFVVKHREEEEHYGIIFEPGMHHRSVGEVFQALKSVFELMDDEDLEETVVRLKRFY
jgi:hypothetical protein